MKLRQATIQASGVLIFLMALLLTTFFAAESNAQGTPNCSYSGSPSLSVLTEHSKWTTNSSSTAGFYCNYNVGGGSAGMAITIDYGCDVAMADRWEDILDGRRGQEGVSIGHFPPAPDNIVGDEYVLKQQTSEQGYTGFVGKFPNRNQMFVRAHWEVISDVVILHSGNPPSNADLDRIITTLWQQNWSQSQVKCVFAKILNQGGDVQITRIAPELVTNPNDLFEGDKVRISRNSGEPCCPFIEIEWINHRLNGANIKRKAVFKGIDTYFDEFTIRRNRSASFSVGTAGNPILDFGGQKLIGWILEKAFGNGGTFVQKTFTSQQSGDLIFINLNSVVVLNPLPSNQLEVLTLEGSPEFMSNANGPAVTVNSGQRSVLSNGSLSQPQAYDPNTVDRWFEPFVDVNIAPPTQQPPPVQQPPTSGGSSTPQITGVQIPNSLSLNQAVSWNINFSDSDGDINWVRFEERISGSWVLTGEFDPNVLGQQSGSITISSTCSQSGQFEKRVRLYDASGNESAAYEYTMNCADSGTPPSNSNPPPSRNISNSGGLAQFDADGDCFLSEPEFFTITDAWITEQIDNALFFEAVDAWISQTSVCSVVAADVTGLRLEEVSLSQLRSGSIYFEVSGQSISSTSVQIFNLQGNSVFSETQSGTSLRWNQRSTEGHHVANGVYLYRVSVTDDYGISVYSEVRKLLVIN